MSSCGLQKSNGTNLSTDWVVQSYEAHLVQVAMASPTVYLAKIDAVQPRKNTHLLCFMNGTCD